MKEKKKTINDTIEEYAGDYYSKINFVKYYLFLLNIKEVFYTNRKNYYEYLHLDENICKGFSSQKSNSSTNTSNCKVVDYRLLSDCMIFKQNFVYLLNKNNIIVTNTSTNSNKTNYTNNRQLNQFQKSKTNTNNIYITDSLISNLLHVIFKLFTTNINSIKSDIGKVELEQRLISELFNRNITNNNTTNTNTTTNPILNFFTPKNLLSDLIYKIIDSYTDNDNKLMIILSCFILLNTDYIYNREIIGNIYIKLFILYYVKLKRESTALKIINAAYYEYKNKNKIYHGQLVRLLQFSIKYKSSFPVLFMDNNFLVNKPYKNISITEIMDNNSIPKTLMFYNRKIKVESTIDIKTNKRQYLVKSNDNNIDNSNNSSNNRILEVEDYALYYYNKEFNVTGVHGENLIMPALFSIFFWEVIYEITTNTTNTSNSSSYISPFQTLPIGFDYDSYEFFYKPNRDKINKILINLSNSSYKDISTSIVSFFNNKRMINNEFVKFGFKKQEENLLVKIAVAFGGKALAKLFKYTCKNFSRVGFPDLFLFKKTNNNMKDELQLIEGSMIICEVKSAKDRLSENQISWIANLVECNIKVEVFTIENI